MAHLASHFIKNIKRFNCFKRVGRPQTLPSRAAKTLGLVATAALAVAANSVFAQPTSAATSPKTTWSFGEARWLGQKYIELIDEQCHHDAACETEIYAALLESGDDNAIIATLFNNTQFMYPHLDPYGAKFTYFFNDIAPASFRRDFDRPEPLYPTTRSKVIFYFDDGSSNQVFNIGLVKGRVADTYSLVLSQIPQGRHITGLGMDLETFGRDDYPLVRLIYTIDFKDCLEDDNYNPSMVCETYFTTEGLQTRAVHPDNLTFDPEPIEDFQPAYIPGLFEPASDPTDSNDNLVTTNPDHTPTEPAENQPNNNSQNPEQTSDQPLQIPNTGSTNSFTLTSRNQSALTDALKAPNTGALTHFGSQLDRQGTSDEISETPSNSSNVPYSILAALMLLLVAFLISVPFTFRVKTARKVVSNDQNSPKSSKKSRKSIDIRSKVR